ncbi:hypothetical protein HYY69_02110 [Candidatus Woesearchaeota archaeon]|nr:hypothetical protein [Candidatus Woesearchaeota archaeon]
MRKEVSLEHLVEKHAKHKHFHRQLTKHMTMIILVVSGLVIMVKMLPSLTGFVVASGETVSKTVTSSSSALATVKQSGNRVLFQIYLWVVWLVAIMMLCMVNFEHEIKTRR